MCVLLNVAFWPLYIMLLCYYILLCFLSAELNKKESMYVKFQLVPLRATSSGFQLLHNRKKTTKQALCHGTRIVASSSVLFIWSWTHASTQYALQAY